MDHTRVSLLDRARDGSQGAWQELIGLYTPLVRAWLQRYGLTEHDAEELSQDVLTILVRKLPDFVHSGRTGAFRTWLRVTTANRAKEFWRTKAHRPDAHGGSTFLRAVQQLEDDESDLAQAWDAEHDDYMLLRLFEAISLEFESNSVAAFRRSVIDECDPKCVAQELGMTVAAVYKAKSRIMRRMREMAVGLLDFPGD